MLNAGFVTAYLGGLAPTQTNSLLYRIHVY
jgi:hypothetical protein